MRISDWSSDVCSSDLHRGGKRVAENVRSGRDTGQAGTFDSLLNNPGDGARMSKRSIRRSDAQKQMLVWNGWSAMLDIGEDRLSGILGKREKCRPDRLAGYRSAERGVGKEGFSTCRSRWWR